MFYRLIVFYLYHAHDDESCGLNLCLSMICHLIVMWFYLQLSMNDIIF